jgi:hypothetical protein
MSLLAVFICFLVCGKNGIWFYCFPKKMAKEKKCNKGNKIGTPTISDLTGLSFRNAM